MSFQLPEESKGEICHKLDKITSFVSKSLDDHLVWHDLFLFTCKRSIYSCLYLSLAVKEKDNIKHC